MMRNNTAFKRCTDNCNAKLMWCAENPCYNRASFKKNMKEKKEEKASKGGEKKYHLPNNFKNVLSIMLLGEDFKTMETQFLN
eukprot:1597438-Ditylum_brightwellii.AAC.1